MMFQNGAWLIFVAAVMVASVFVLATSMAALRTGVLPSCSDAQADRGGPHALRLLLDPGADLPRVDSRCQPLDDGVGLADGNSRPRRLPSRAEPDVEHVAVLDDVGLALQALEAALGGLRVRAGLDEVVPADHLGADEPLRDVGVDARRRVEAVRPR
jgi:hypothetical protein